MKRFILPAALFAFLVILPVRADAPKVEKDTAKPVTVPFELLKTGHMAVMVKINGKGPYRVIFDTGAPISLINNKVGKESGLLDNVKKPLFSLFNTAGQTSIKSLEVGDLKAENVNTIVMDHPTVEAISKALGPIEGIVGFPFFARYKTTINYQAKELTFVPNGFDPPDVMQELAASLMTMINEKQPKAKVLAPAAQWGMIAAKDSKDEDAGVVVKEVYADSPAAKAGMKAGDRILTLDGRWTDSLRDLYDAAGFVKPGTAAKVVFLRDGKEKELTITPTSGS
jgi:membrane-associated protease RseP (regulator of RpoE activity)